MNDVMKPWIVIASAIVLNWLAYTVKLYNIHVLIKPLFWLLTSFAFGLSLNDFKKKSNAWVLKLVIAGLLLVLFLYEINLIHIAFFDQIFHQLRIETYFIRLIYIWCGWAFFRK